MFNSTKTSSDNDFDLGEEDFKTKKPDLIHDEGGIEADPDEEDLSDLEVGRFWDLPRHEHIDWQRNERNLQNNAAEELKKRRLQEERGTGFFTPSRYQTMHERQEGIEPTGPTIVPPLENAGYARAPEKMPAILRAQRAWQLRNPDMSYRPVSELNTKREQSTRTVNPVDPLAFPNDSYFFQPRAIKSRESKAHPLLAELDHHPQQLCAGPGCMFKFVGPHPAIPGLRSEYSRDQNQYPNIGVVMHAFPGHDPVQQFVPDELIDRHHETCGNQMPNKDCAKVDECPFSHHARYCDGPEHDATCNIENQLVQSESKPDLKVGIIPFKYKNGMYVPHDDFGADRIYTVSSHVIEHLDPRDQSWQPHNIHPFNYDMIEGLRTRPNWSTLLRTLQSNSNKGVKTWVNPDVKVKGEARPEVSNPRTKRKPMTEDELAVLGDFSEMEPEALDLSQFGGTSPGKVIKPNIDPPRILGTKTSYVHVNEPFTAGPPCRFCDDPSNVNDKGVVTQTSTAADGRALYAHPECDNPFGFADTMTTLDSASDLECPNCGMINDKPGLCTECMSSSLGMFDDPVDVDFTPRVFNSSKNPAVVKIQRGTARVNQNLGYDPRRHPLQHMMHPVTSVQADNIDSQGEVDVTNEPPQQ